MRGCLKNNKDRLRMVIDWLHINNIAILALQETHLMEDAITDLNNKYKHLRFLGSRLSTASGGILFIVSNKAGDPLNIQFEVFNKGRTGMLSLEYGHQELNIVNVYLPNNQIQQRELLESLRNDLGRHQNLTSTELFNMGDWNFVEDKADRSP